MPAGTVVRPHHDKSIHIGMRLGSTSRTLPSVARIGAVSSWPAAGVDTGEHRPATPQGSNGRIGVSGRGCVLARLDLASIKSARPCPRGAPPEPCRRPAAQRAKATGLSKLPAFRGSVDRQGPGISIGRDCRPAGRDTLVRDISSTDQRDLRAARSYCRAVWGYRATLAGFAVLCLSVAVLAVGLPSPVSMVGVGVAFAAVVVGVLLVWSAVLPLTRHQRKVLAKYGFNSAERASVMIRLIWRDVFGRVRIRT